MLRFRWIIQLICRSKFDRWNFIPSRPFELTNDLYVQRVCMHVRCIPSWGNISFREMRFNFETMRRSPRIFASFVSICQGFRLFAIPSPPSLLVISCIPVSRIADWDFRNLQILIFEIGQSGNIKYFASIEKAPLKYLIIGEKVLFWYNERYIRKLMKIIVFYFNNVYRNMNKITTRSKSN